MIIEDGILLCKIQLHNERKKDLTGVNSDEWVDGAIILNKIEAMHVASPEEEGINNTSIYSYIQCNINIPFSELYPVWKESIKKPIFN